MGHMCFDEITPYQGNKVSPGSAVLMELWQLRVGQGCCYCENVPVMKIF
jgi:hypothetical protein